MEEPGWREIRQEVENDSKFIIIRTMKLYGLCRMQSLDWKQTVKKVLHE